MIDVSTFAFQKVGVYVATAEEARDLLEAIYAQLPESDVARIDMRVAQGNRTFVVGYRDRKRIDWDNGWSEFLEGRGYNVVRYSDLCNDCNWWAEADADGWRELLA